MKYITTTQATASFTELLIVPLRNEMASPFQDATTALLLLNNTGYLKQASEINGSKLYGLVQRKQIPLKGRGVSPGGSFTAVTDAFGREYWIQGEGAAPVVRFGIGDCLPAGMNIQSFSATIKPASVHASLPSTKPKLTLERVGSGADIGTEFEVLATANEWTKTVSDYQESHIIETAPSTPVPILGNYNHQLVVHGEDGDNSKTGLKILSIAIVLTF